MSREEAVEILLLYRPDRAEADDPELGPALELARSDPEFGAWFEQHCQVQRKIAAAFQSIPVPAGLKEQIISERKARLTKSKRRTLIAACVALIVAAVLLAVQLGYVRHARPNGRHAHPRPERT